MAEGIYFMRVFLTGGGGMVGRNLAAHKSAARHTLIAPSRQQLDLSNFQDITHFIQDSRPDIIIHAAGKVGGIKANIADPYGFFAENLMLGQNVIGAAKECKVPRLINLGSSCIYPCNAPSPLKETDVLTGSLEPTNEGYALAKIAALRLCDYISKQFDELSYKTIIPCNLFGPFDKFDPVKAHLIPAIIRKIDDAVTVSARSVTIWGDGSARREFMFAGDFAGLLWRACEMFDSLPHVMNAGVGHDYSVKDYYEIIASVIGYRGQFDFDLSQPTGMAQKLTSCELASNWGWDAQVKLADGIAKTYRYFKGAEPCKP